MNKINTLTLNNFKFFHGNNPLNFERKNVLLYGENGSGKSSIYWALYTFLQSVYKDKVEVEKYFDESNSQNLINRFAPQNHGCEVEVEFVDGNQTATTKKICHETVNTKEGELVKATAQASDFINYRLLSKVYDFTNRDQIDLFPLFEKEILMFVTFGTEFEPDNPNASDWWKYIKPGMQPRGKMHEQPYKDFKSLVREFNLQFEKFLNDIIETANKYLQEKFGEKIKLGLEYVHSTYDVFVEGSRTKRDHKTTPPKVILTLEWLHTKLVEGQRQVARPHTFLNEARLTTIALSLRFAILDYKYIAGSPKLLVLDDLLISLDMSNRGHVLELILKEFTEYQILLMTHDRGFFNLVRRRIEVDCDPADWLVKELYQDENAEGIPVPFIPENQDYIQRARKYIKSCDYPAAANYLRKESEYQLKRLLPKCKTIFVNDEGSKPLQLDTLIDNFRNFYESFGQDFTPFKRLKEYKDLLLNPLSHDNVDTPIYKQELLKLIDVLLEMRKLEFKTLVSIKGGEQKLILEEEADNGKTWLWRIWLKEHLRAIKLLNGEWVLSNPVGRFDKRQEKGTGTYLDVNEEHKIKVGHNRIQHFLSVADQTKSLLDILFFDRRTLRSYLN